VGRGDWVEVEVDGVGRFVRVLELLLGELDLVDERGDVVLDDVDGDALVDRGAEVVAGAAGCSVASVVGSVASGEASPCS
jgi:hypothetical protein